MGCSASRPNTLLHHDNLEENPSSSLSLDSAFSSPLPRALSLPTPLVHHPALKKGDTHHLVSLTSTTYGSLLLIDPIKPNLNCQDLRNKAENSTIPDPPVESFSPDSVINTWELMDGLDDELDLEMGPSVNPISFKHDRQIESPAKPISISANVNVSEDRKPLWKHLSEESLLSKLDPNVVSSYRRALSSRQLGYTNSPLKSIKSMESSPICSLSTVSSLYHLPATENKIVVYFTSLRGIRKTYEDCCAVRMIFRGFRVPVEERDISMDSMYRKELQSAVKGKAVSLPQVFIRGKYVGGVEEIRQLNEIGELTKLLEGFPVRDPRFVCESCGDARFLPCQSCNGSRKVFEEDEGKLRRCLDCNENGLIRCPGCCY
ncbi:hypothetical protein HS088_TW05G00683 [Tripterygium wilfordii]|uniref:Glutaredoxin domain-containing protein n=1 Tax=Tripterygium wilfordii TaxID=458696 RepID=A0A7J7DNL2_TRIWF|nr:uncharacterized protein At5g39865-like [Tripterygium wilfordii]KAF5747952.1 hypothetical protein HS088_TW05G00683 [Tripterygium wilfordii]